jgi:hypothetical protein
MPLSRIFIFTVFLCSAASAAQAHHPVRTPEANPAGNQDSISSGAMVNSPTANMLGKNRALAGFAFDYLRYNSIPAAEAHALHHNGHDVHGKNYETFYNIDFGYGISQDIDVYLSAPIVSKNSIDVHNHGAAQGRKASATGFGDMRLLGKYRFWKKGVEAALITAVKFPTGRTSAKRPNGNKFEIENQPGSGSWDGDFGIAVSRSFKKRFSAASSFLYHLKTPGGQDFNAGDVFQYNAGLSYALRELGNHPNLSLVLELNHRWALKDRSRIFSSVPDSGGTSIFITPGLQADLTRNFSAFCALALPVYQNLGGEHEETVIEVLAGLSVAV